MDGHAEGPQSGIRSAVINHSENTVLFNEFLRFRAYDMYMIRMSLYMEVDLMFELGLLHCRACGVEISVTRTLAAAVVFESDGILSICHWFRFRVTIQGDERNGSFCLGYRLVGRDRAVATHYCKVILTKIQAGTCLLRRLPCRICLKWMGT